jgi:hypothetical protein
MQSFRFILFMILAAHQSGKMLQRQYLLNANAESWSLSATSIQQLMKNLADQSANLTLEQRRKLINIRLHAFLVARLLGKQSWQDATMRIPVKVLHHLMTTCIPRIRIAPFSMPEKPVKPAWQLTGTVVYDSSGYICRGEWSPYHWSIKAITSQCNQHLIALMDSNGLVWIGNADYSEKLFHLLHFPKTNDENATAVAIHPFENIIAVAIRGYVIMYRFSQFLKPEFLLRVLFHENPGSFCPSPPQFSANELGWNQDGTFLTAMSGKNLSKCYFFNLDPFKVKYDTVNAVLRSFREDISPSCSCFSLDGKLTVTGYHNGTLMTRSFVNTEKGPSLVCLKIIRDFVPNNSIENIVPNPYNSLVFAIEAKTRFYTCVLIVCVSHDGSVTITATIPDAKSPHFHKDWLLVSSRNKILFYKMNRCNIPCLVTEFHLKNSGSFLHDIGTFFVKTSPNGKDILYYTSRCGGSKLHMAEISSN